MPHYILPHCERRCAPFVWMQTRSFALPPASADLCPHIQMQKLPPQQAGERQVHTYPLYSSTEGLQVRAEKQLQKYVRLALPKAEPPLRTERRLSSLAQLITISLCLSDSLRSPSEVIPSLFFFHLLSVVPLLFSALTADELFADEAVYMRARSLSIDHGQRRYDLHHHSPYLQILSSGIVNNTVTSTDKMQEIWKRAKVKRIIWSAVIP